MQTALTYRTNRDLFSNYYLDEHLPETEAWDELSDDELREAKADIMDLWEREKGTAPKRNESQLEEKFIRPMFRKLGIPFEVEESTSRTQRRPDYGFFESEDAARGAFERREEGGDFYKHAVAVADAKRWGRPLDTRGSGEHERDFENPSYQIHVYLQETPAQWAVLTDGKKWRLYYGPTSHRLDSYYEIDLPTVLEKGDLEDFKYFYLFFRHGAFLEDSSGECFLDDVYDESNVFARELGEDLQDNIYQAIKVLSEGFMQYPDNDLSEEDLDLIHDSSLIYLYRLIFVLYAESEGRDLLDTNNEIYEESYSLNTLKQDVAEELDSPSPKYRDWQGNLWDRLDELFKLIDRGSKSRGIPEKDLYIPAYNGGLFRTDPDGADSDEARFIANHQVGDAYLAEVIELLTRSQNGNGGGKIFVDYSSLDVRHLGSIYEGLLEYQIDVADEPLALEDGEYVPAGEGDEVVVEEGEVHLSTGSGERKATGSYYTPEYVVEHIVEETLGPLVDDIRGSLVGQSAFDEGGFAEEFAEEVFDLKILDPAMGSGHFLTSAIDYLAREIIDAQERQAAQQGIETVDEDHDINWARRQVAQRCIYGVDLNPLAVELAKVSLWLRTLAAEQPLAFLNHHLKTGNSLVGSDIETVLNNGNTEIGNEEGQLTLQQSFDRTRQQALEHVTDQFEELLAIDNETLDDIKEMEAVYEEVRKDPLYQHLMAMVNVHTAEQFGLDVPRDAYERMAAALREDSWAGIEEEDWYRSAQQMAADEHFFHWELEFPIAFYEQDGVRKDDGGFDAVIGNPPYIQSYLLGDSLKDYLEKKYESTTQRWDIYLPFTELGIQLSTNKISYIEPSMFFRRDYGKGLRKYISNHNVSVAEIVDLSDIQVFDGATNYVAIVSLSHTRNKSEFKVIVPQSEDRFIQDEKGELYFYTLDNNDLNSDFWDVIPADVALIIDAIPDSFVPLEDVTQFISKGIDTSADSVFYFEKDKKENSDIEEEIFRPLLKGEDIDRYIPPKTDRSVLFPYDGDDVIKPAELKSRYPNAWEYLQSNEDQLKSRSYLVDSGYKWYEFWRKREEKIYTNDKILCPEIAKENEFTIDRGDNHNYFNTKVRSIKIGNDIDLSQKELLGILNSSLMNHIYRGISPAKRGGYRSYLTTYLSDLLVPMKCSDDLEAQVEAMLSAKRELEALNLNILDYLGIPNDELPDSMAGDDLDTLQMPVAGVADTPVTKTSDDLESMRIEDVSFKNDGARLVMAIEISYKPEEDDSRETDRWGRLVEEEFETYEVMGFVGLSDAEKALIQNFVPIVIKEAGGFASFRKKATKTKSPLDRLKELTLPDIENIQTGLEQYLEIKTRADELVGKIKTTDKRIDNIVYDIYGLTEEEIDIVESAVQDD
ncbi:Eco57I restriction-modification methylase domain-containing protein [Salinirubellus sp. GCM10025818]|uniref:Eco57I restriction-modification methylase domain-containing protein n=1 Tax=Salinirubellus TaxID=2162630 RepID=UPI0030CBEC96